VTTLRGAGFIIWSVDGTEWQAVRECNGDSERANDPEWWKISHGRYAAP
jgi:hypothetical protein